MEKDRTIKYEVKEKIASLDSDSKMPKELRLISWNNKEPKYDLRSWKQKDDGTETCGKGCTFDYEELYSLYLILQNLFEKED